MDAFWDEEVRAVYKRLSPSCFSLSVVCMCASLEMVGFVCSLICIAIRIDCANDKCCDIVARMV
jgi:hypothetical protein